VRAAETIVSTQRGVGRKRAVLVGMSGIDGSGKTYLAHQVRAELVKRGLSVALLGADGWLNLPSVRFSRTAPARVFLDQGIRLDEMFADVLLPLRNRRHIVVEVNHLEETSSAFERRVYEFRNIDVVLAEGIFLYQRRLRPHFDLAFWIDCSFPTALNRAIARSQEGLAAMETIQAYETIYFPAQRLHLGRDNPREMADRVIRNDENADRLAIGCRGRCRVAGG